MKGQIREMSKLRDSKNSENFPIRTTSIIFNLGNSKNCQIEEIEKFAIWEIKKKFYLEHFKNL